MATVFEDDESYAYGSPAGAVAHWILTITVPTVTAATTSVSVTSKLELTSNKSLVDSSNTWHQYGSVGSGEHGSTSINFGSSGGTKTVNTASSPFATSYTSTTTGTVSATLDDIGAIGERLYVNVDFTIPKRPPNKPSKPAPPTISTLGVTSAVISWADPATNGSTLTGWKIELSDTATFTTILKTYTDLLHSDDEWGTTYTPTDLAPATKYYARVYAYNAVGTSDPSDASVAFETLPGVPGAPALPTISGLQSTAATVNYVAPASALTITSYTIQYATSSDFTAGLVTTSSTSLSKSLSGLVRTTAYYVHVRATNSEGDGDWSPTATFTTAAAPPGAPVGISTSNYTKTTVTVGVTAPVDNGGAAITGYTITAATNAAFTTGIVQRTSISSFPYVMAGLTANTPYWIRAFAVNSAGSGPNGPTATFNTSPDVPGVPLNLQIVSVTQTSVTFSWSPPTSDGGAAITGYKALYTPAVQYTGLTSPATRTGMTPATNYTVQVAALNSAGYGPYTATVAFTTDSVPARTGSLGANAGLGATRALDVYYLDGFLPVNAGLTGSGTPVTLTPPGAVGVTVDLVGVVTMGAVQVRTASAPATVGLVGATNKSSWLPATVGLQGLVRRYESIGVSVNLYDATLPRVTSTPMFTVGLVGVMRYPARADQIYDPELYDIEHDSLYLSPVTEEGILTLVELMDESGVGLPTTLTLEAVKGRSDL